MTANIILGRDRALLLALSAEFMPCEGCAPHGHRHARKTALAQLAFGGSRSGLHTLTGVGVPRDAFREALGLSEEALVSVGKFPCVRMLLLNHICCNIE